MTINFFFAPIQYELNFLKEKGQLNLENKNLILDKYRISELSLDHFKNVRLEEVYYPNSLFGTPSVLMGKINLRNYGKTNAELFYCSVLFLSNPNKYSISSGTNNGIKIRIFYEDGFLIIAANPKNEPAEIFANNPNQKNEFELRIDMWNKEVQNFNEHIEKLILHWA